MRNHVWSVVAVACSMWFGLTVGPEAGQAPAGAAPAGSARYAAPKTPWGDPDIQGGYSNKDENGVPFERPGSLAGKQVGAFDASELEELSASRDAGRLEAARGIGGRETGAGPIHWYEHYGAKNSRAWMVIDPPDGLIPSQTPAARARLEAQARGRGAGSFGEGGKADSYTDRSFYDRCITRGLPGSMMPAIYGNAYDITQAPGVVAIRYEMIHETRVIPLNNSPRTGLRSHMGDARGHWEGDTLVVDTTNMNGKTWMNEVGDVVSHAEHIVERFIPTDAERITYRATVTDPIVYTRPWTIEIPLNRQANGELLEVACHEDNGDLQHLKDVRDEFRARQKKEN
jgi:hypothetical protein